MTDDDAKRFIKVITGCDVDENSKALEIAWALGNKLILAVQILDPAFR